MLVALILSLLVVGSLQDHDTLIRQKYASQLEGTQELTQRDLEMLEMSKRIKLALIQLAKQNKGCTSETPNKGITGGRLKVSGGFKFVFIVEVVRVANDSGYCDKKEAGVPETYKIVVIESSSPGAQPEYTFEKLPNKEIVVQDAGIE